MFVEPVTKSMRHLCLIPVRGGSKGLPRKNATAVVDGISLLEWSIRQAVPSRLGHALLVSTEDAELAQIADRCGVEVAVRPAALSEDSTPTADVVQHLLRERDPEGILIDAITILQATSPLRQTYDIDAAVELFETGAYDSVVSGCEYEGPHPAKLYYASAGAVAPVAPDFESARRQDLPKVYRRNGAIFMVTRKHFKATGRLWGGNTGMLVMPKERSVDVDTLADLETVRRYLDAAGAAPDSGATKW
jgi:CMP-N,N'-diacetyllegionaminic acid synthase